MSPVDGDIFLFVEFSSENNLILEIQIRFGKRPRGCNSLMAKPAIIFALQCKTIGMICRFNLLFTHVDINILRINYLLNDVILFNMARFHCV